MNAEQEKRKLQDTILIIAKEIDKICKENNIDYEFTDDNSLQRHTIFLKCQTEETSHSRYEVSAHRCHTGNRYH